MNWKLEKAMCVADNKQEIKMLKEVVGSIEADDVFDYNQSEAFDDLFGE